MEQELVLWNRIFLRGVGWKLGLFGFMVAILVRCSSRRHLWLLLVTAWLKSRFAGSKSSASTTKAHLLLTFCKGYSLPVCIKCPQRLRERDFNKIFLYRAATNESHCRPHPSSSHSQTSQLSNPILSVLLPRVFLSYVSSPKWPIMCWWGC